MSGAVVSEMLIRIAADAASLRSEMNSIKSQMGEGFDSIRNSANSLKNTLLGLFAGFSVAAITKEFVEQADAMALLSARLKNATGDGADFSKAQADIYRIAQQNNMGLQEATTLYTKMHEPVKRLGGTTQETGGIVEAFALSLRLGGASTQEASAATLQFAQAMGSGKLQGDEFRSMAEASPRFMKALAEGMGVPIDKLKEMGSESKLTADVVGNSLLKALTQLKSEAANIPDTVGGAFQRMKNDILLVVDGLNKNTGLTLGIAGLIEAVRVDLLPAIKVELGGAFQAVGEWITRNKEGITEVWEQVRAAGGEVWELVKAFGAVVGFVTEVVVQSGAMRTIFETVRLLVAGLQDGMDIVVATFSLMGAQILKVIGIFSDSAKLAAQEAEAAGLAVIKRFQDGDTAVARVAASFDDARNKASGLKGEMQAGGVSAAQMKRDLGFLMDGVGQTTNSFRTLTNANKELTAEQKKSADEAKKQEEAFRKVILSIQDKVSILQREINGEQALTDVGKMALAVMSDIRDGKIKMNATRAEAITKALEEAFATERSAQALREEAANTKAAYEEKIKAGQEAQKYADDIQKQLEKQREENLALKLTREELGKLEQARLDEQIAIYEQIVAREELEGMCNAETEAHKATLDALRQLKDARAEGVILETAKEAREEWEKTAKSIEESLTDSLMRGFESGKGFLQNLISTAKNLFQSLVLKPIIQAVIQPAGSAITSALGFTSNAASAAGSASGGFGGSGLGFLGSVGSAIGGFGTSFGAGLSLAMEGSTMMGLSAAGNAIAAGEIGAGLGLGLGAAAPYLLAAIAVMSLLDGGGGPKTGGIAGMGEGSIDALLAGGLRWNRPYEDESRIAQDDWTKTKLFGISSQYGALSKMFGGSGSPMQFGLQWSQDPAGDAQSDITGLAGSMRFRNLDIDRTEEAFMAAMSEMSTKMVFAALQQSDLGDAFKDYFNSIDVEGATEAQLSAALQMATSVQSMTASVEDLGGVFSTFSDLTVEARVNLAALTGGFDQFIAKTGKFVENYFTDSEKAVISAKSIRETLLGGGFSELQIDNLSDRGSFRDLLNSINLSATSGQQQLAALLNVSESFAQLADFFEENSGGSLGEFAGRSSPLGDFQQMMQDAGIDAIVRAAYGAIGRTDIGTSTDNIGQGGYDYWMSMLRSDQLTPDSFVEAFSYAAGADRQTIADAVAAATVQTTTNADSTVDALNSVGSSVEAGTEAVVAAVDGVAEAVTQLAESVAAMANDIVGSIAGVVEATEENTSAVYEAGNVIY